MHRALLIGVSKYSSSNLTDLQRVPDDLDCITEVLNLPGSTPFEKIQRRETEADTTRAEFIIAISEFLEDGPRNGVDLIYVACHGEVDKNAKLALLPSDYNPDASLATRVTVPDLIYSVSDLPGRSLILILDCCFADTGAGEATTQLARLTGEFNSDKRPNYCIVATTRMTDPATGFGFAPNFADGMRNVAAVDGEERASAHRIFTHAAKRLRAQNYQVPRIWSSIENPIEIGRIGNLDLSVEKVRELYELSTDWLVVGVDLQDIDLLVKHETDFGFIQKLGVMIIPNEGHSMFEDAATILQSHISSNTITNGLILVPDQFSAPPINSEQIKVQAFFDFRRALLPAIPYIERATRTYELEEDGIYQRGCYVELSAERDEEHESQPLGSIIDTWIEAGVEGQRMLLLLAEFGSGKTTTAARVFWEQAQKFIGSPSTERLPIFVNLRHFRKSMDVYGLIERTIRVERGLPSMSYEFLTELNNAGRVLWILDGFDEMAVRVTNDVLRENFQELMGLSAKKSKILLTSRTSFFKDSDELDVILRTHLRPNGNAVKGEDYEVYNVKPFSRQQIFEFIKRRIGTEITANETIEKIDSIPEIGSLASRPILLEMLVTELPRMVENSESIINCNLYRSYTNRMLERDDWRHVMVELQDRIVFCEELAWHFFTKGLVEISYSDIPYVLKDKFPDIAKNAEDFQVFTRAIQLSSFLARSGNLFVFSHKSFMEYFTAAYLIRRLAAHDYSALSERVLTKEISKFLAELLSQEVSAPMIIGDALSSGKFSIRSFWWTFLKPRAWPSIRREATPENRIHRRTLNHIFLHLIVPVLFVFTSGALGTSLSRDNEHLPILSLESVYSSSSWMLIATLFVLFVYFSIYTIRALMGIEGDPVQRFNLLTIACFGAQVSNSCIPSRISSPDQVSLARSKLDREEQKIGKLVEAEIRGTHPQK